MYLTSPQVNTSPSAIAVISGLALAWIFGMAAADKAFPFFHLGSLAATLPLVPQPLALCIASFVNSWISVSPASVGAEKGLWLSQEVHS